MIRIAKEGININTGAKRVFNVTARHEEPKQSLKIIVRLLRSQ